MMEKGVFFLIGLAAGYYVVKHYRATGKMV
jgi:hypothetical protein